MNGTPQPQHSHLPYWLQVGEHRIAVCDLYDASSTYQIARDQADGTIENWPDGFVYLDDQLMARISYNGRVWAPKPWVDGDVPLMEAA